MLIQRVRARAIGVLLLSLAHLAIIRGGDNQVSNDGPRTAPPADAAISGTVVDRATGRTLAEATVELGNLDPAIGSGRVVVTDVRGRFVFHGLPASETYYLRGAALGYMRTRWRNPRPTDELRPAPPELIALTPGQWIADVNLGLPKLGAIRGRVVDEVGAPLVGVAVRLAQYVMVAGHRRVAGGPVATTDDRGEYRIADLEDGDYLAAVLSTQSTVPTGTPAAQTRKAIGQLDPDRYQVGKGALLQWPAVQVDPTHLMVISNFPIAPRIDGVPGVYPTTWFPSTDQFSAAGMVRLRNGQELYGVDFQLRPVRSSTLRGTVSPLPGFPMLLRLIPAGLETLGFGFDAATTVVEPDGRFTFFNVRAGSYTLLVQSQASELTRGSFSARLADAPGYPSGQSWAGFSSAAGVGYIVREGTPSTYSARLSVTLGEGNADLSVLLNKSGTIAGRIVFDGETPQPRQGTLIAVRAEPADGDVSLGYLQAWVDPKTWTFKLQGLQRGRYVMSVGSSLLVASITSRGIEVPDRMLDATTAVDFDDLIITLTAKATEVTGAVSGIRPGDSAAVLVFPDERRLWTNYGITPTGIRTTTVAGGNTYRLSGLPAGAYRLVALPIEEIDNWRDPKFLESVLPNSVRVILVDGRAMTQGLALARR